MRRRSSLQDIESHIAARLRERRIAMGLTQQKLADLVGVTSQQTHKYEHGINVVSAARLYQLACVLAVPVTYFFDGLGRKAHSDTIRRQNET
jgi:transcriptional regulator with XRE-family HTH domain